MLVPTPPSNPPPPGPPAATDTTAVDPLAALRRKLSESSDQSLDAPTILDMEASGFGRDSYPVEVGFVLPNGKSFCSLIRPAPQWTHWDDAAQALHHISRDLAVRRGHEPVEVARALNEQLAGQIVYSDGWVNDYTWLAVLFERAGLSPSFKLESLRSLLTEDEAEVWHVVKQQVSNELHLQRHRASTDALLLQMTWRRLAEQRQQRLSARSD
ncbi:hypothetical protein BH09PSE5_BH09PSE5_21450 [soil metagenome]